MTGSAVVAEHMLSLERVSDEGDAERSRIARALHDSVAQTLTYMHMELEGIRRGALGKEELDQTLGDLERSARTAMGAMRAILFDVRNLGVDPMDIVSDLRRAAMLFEARTQIAVSVVGTSSWPVTIAAAVGEELLAIADASLANVRWHSGASRVLIELSSTETQLRMRLLDDGSAVQESVRGVRPRLGFIGMRERAALLGGELTAVPTSPIGFEVILVIPWDNA